MDRNVVLKHSRAVRLEHRLLPDFVELLEELCRIRSCPEYLQLLIQTLSIPGLNGEVVKAVLEYFEREYCIIKIERLSSNYGVNVKQLVNII